MKLIHDSKCAIPENSCKITFLELVLDHSPNVHILLNACEGDNALVLYASVDCQPRDRYICARLPGPNRSLTSGLRDLSISVDPRTI